MAVDTQVTSTLALTQAAVSNDDGYVDDDGNLVASFPSTGTPAGYIMRVSVPSHGITENSKDRYSIRITDQFDSDTTWLCDDFDIIDKDTLDLNGWPDNLTTGKIEIVVDFLDAPFVDSPESDPGPVVDIFEPSSDSGTGHIVERILPTKFTFTTTVTGENDLVIPDDILAQIDFNNIVENISYKIDDGDGNVEIAAAQFVAPNKILRQLSTGVSFSGGSKNATIEFVSAPNPPIPPTPNPAATLVPLSRTGRHAYGTSVFQLGNHLTGLNPALYPPTVVTPASGVHELQVAIEAARRFDQVRVSWPGFSQGLPAGTARDLALISYRYENFTNVILSLAKLIRNGKKFLVKINPETYFVGFESVDGIAPELIAASRARLIARGYIVISETELRAIVLAAESDAHLESLLLDGGYRNIVRPLVPLAGAASSAWATRAVTAIRLAGICALVVQAGGFVEQIILTSLAPDYRYRQGRLQLVNKIANTDDDRLAQGTTIYYAPINSSNPSDSKVTLQGNFIRNLTFPDWFAYKFVLPDGTVPSVDVSEPSPIPFSYDADKLPAQAKAGDGVPFDIFITRPNVRVANSERIGPGIISCAVPRTAQELPRLFYLNWATKTKRRDAGVGHKLVWSNQIGLCLYARKTNENYITDGLPGFMTGSGTETKDWMYLYLGSGVAIDDVVYCTPGCRNLWNYVNRLPYNDFRIEHTAWGVPRTADDTYDAYIKPGSEIWRHIYLDPKELGTSMPAAVPYGGKCTLGICGPLRWYVKHLQDDNNPVMAEGNNDDILARSAWGYGDCTPIVNTATGVHMQSNFEPTPGINIIEVRANIRANCDPWEYNWTFVGHCDYTRYYYNLNFGFNVAFNPALGRQYATIMDAYERIAAGHPLINDAALAASYPGMATLRRYDDQFHYGLCGFGMQGDC